jgi:hypothetical protein
VLRRLVVLCALVALVLAACGGDDDDGGLVAGADIPTGTGGVGGKDGGDGPPPVLDAPVSSPPNSDGGQAQPSGAQRVEPQPGMDNVRSQVFDTMNPPTAVDGGVLVRFYGGVAPCFVLDHYDVEETATDVTITLYGGSDPSSPDVACDEIAVLYEVMVPLAAPLGDRAVVEGAAP